MALAVQDSIPRTRPSKRASASCISRIVWRKSLAWADRVTILKDGTGQGTLLVSRELGLLALLLLVTAWLRIAWPVSWDRFATLENFASIVRNLAFEGILA